MQQRATTRLTARSRTLGGISAPVRSSVAEGMGLARRRQSSLPLVPKRKEKPPRFSSASLWAPSWASARPSFSLPLVLAVPTVTVAPLREKSHEVFTGRRISAAKQQDRGGHGLH